MLKTALEKQIKSTSTLSNGRPLSEEELTLVVGGKKRDSGRMSNDGGCGTSDTGTMGCPG